MSVAPKLVRIALLHLWMVGASQAATVVYPRQESDGDRRDEYPLQVLRLALQKAQSKAVLKPHPVFMLQVRAMSEVERGAGLDVIWTMTSIERERTLLPIRIPIDRGLLGWRLLLVRRDKLDLFSGVTSLGQLARLRGGQGADWPDTIILRAAGLTIDESARYNDLFSKLDAGRIDYFPRSVQEIWGELETHRSQGLEVEPSLAIHYPTAMYFFVNKARLDLAEEISKGLKIAVRDGSFEALFLKNYGDILARANLEGRHVLKLTNPLLPAETPVQDKGLWFTPTSKAAR